MIRQLPFLVRMAFKGLWQHRRNNWPVLWTLFFAALIQMLMAMGAWSLDRPLRTDPTLWEVRVVPSQNSDPEIALTFQSVQAKLSPQFHAWDFRVLDTLQAKQEFENMWGKEWSEELLSNPFPPSLKISKKETQVSEADLDALLQGLQQNLGTNVEVYHARERIHELETRRAQMIWATAGVVGIILLLLWGILGNSVRGLLLTRQESLRTMHLLGASPWFLGLPVYLELVLLAGVATILALGATILGVNLMWGWTLDSIQLLSLFGLALSPPLITWAVTQRTLKRFLREQDALA